ncbi:MAG: hypothetical protein ACLQU2_34305, partial [Candidatus Binataceae bacterium]
LRASGMLAVRIRQLTAKGLSPSKTSSLVGRYPGLEPAVDQRLSTAHFRFAVSAYFLVRERASIRSRQVIQILAR